MNDRRGPGPGGPMGSKAVADAAARAARQMGPAGAGGPMPGQINVLEAFATFFGLNGPTFQAMRVVPTTCMCGKCQGVAVQVDVRMHFLPGGMPELISRGDATRPPVQTVSCEPESGATGATGVNGCSSG